MKSIVLSAWYKKSEEPSEPNIENSNSVYTERTNIDNIEEKLNTIGLKLLSS